MRTMFLAAAAALNLGIGAAYAGEIEGIQSKLTSSSSLV